MKKIVPDLLIARSGPPAVLFFARKFGLRYHGLPAGTDDSFFLPKELQPGYLRGVSGGYATPKGYLTERSEADAFDRAFPHKEKLELPYQLF